MSSHAVNLAILTGDQIPVRSLVNTTGGITAFFNRFREQVAIVFNYIGVWRTTPDTCEDGFSARPPKALEPFLFGRTAHTLRRQSVGL